MATSTKIVTLYDDSAKSISLAPRTKVEAISNNAGTGLEALLDGKLALAGGTMTGHITFAGGTTQSTIKGLKWNSINSKNPYIGYATDQTDGTFVVSSLLGTNYASGLAIGGGSGNLLWQGSKIPMGLSDLGITATATELNYVDGVTSNIQTQLNGKAASSHTHDYAASSHTHTNIIHQDTRSVNQRPDEMPTGVSIHLKSSGTDGLSDGGNYHPLLCLKDWGDYSGGPYGQLSITQNQNMWFRASTSGTAWGSWKKVLDSSNYTSYAPPYGKTMQFKSAHSSDWTSATGMSGKTYMGGWHGSLTSGTAGYISIGGSSSATMDLFVDGDIWAWENYRMPCIHFAASSATPTAKGKGDIWFVT